MMTDLLFLGFGLVIGFGTGWICHRGRQTTQREAAEQQLAEAEKILTAVRIENAKASERIRILEQSLQTAQAELGQERQFNISLHAELSRERTSRNHLDQRLEQQKQELLQLQQRLSHEIRLLMQQVLEEKSQTLSDLNKKSLNTIIAPISEKLQEFKQKVEEQHYRETRELIVLHNKIDHLESTNRWPHSNGSSTHPTIKPASAHSDEDEQNGSHYIPPALEPASIEPALQQPRTHAPATPVEEPATEEQAPAEALAEGESAEPEDLEIRPFLPKQQVEIDNFLKRTIGRAQRKKSRD